MTNNFGENEVNLLKKLSMGDCKAFEALYNTYKTRLFLFAIKFVKNEELAGDIVHDVFIKIWEKRAEIRDDQNFNAFLHTVCKNNIFNFLKKIARDKKLKFEIIKQTESLRCKVEEDYFFGQYEKITNNALNKLPPRRKQVFMMCKMDGKTYDEVACCLGISKNAIKEHMVKASKFLKSYIQEYAEISI